MPRRPVVLAPLLFILFSCSTVRKINVYTVPEEMAVGEVFSAQVEAFYPILRDPRVQWYVNHRGRQFADLSDRRDLPYDFGVVDSPELNAFAIPGGHIYFNLGMIEATETESELMGIVAHEIGHVVAKHSMKQLSQSTIVAIIGNIALNQYPNQWAALAANLFGAGGFLKLSRDAEREADAIGFQIMIRAGYDPEGMVRIFEKLLAKYDQDPGMLDKMFSTHPPTRERIENIKGLIAAAEMPPNLIHSSRAYAEMYNHVITKYYSEEGRRRWKEVLEAKQNKDDRDKDRLPWDTKEDEKERERELEDEEKREEEREKREKEQSEQTVSAIARLSRPGELQ